MSQSVLKFNTPLSFNECKAVIDNFAAETSILIEGTPGTGKSSLLAALAMDNGDEWRKPGDYFPNDKYTYVYVDCGALDHGDIIMRVPVHATKSQEQYTSSLFDMGDKRPKYIMFDERGKMPKSQQPLVTRVDLERTVGDSPLPEGSKVFSTTNYASDGVGDILPAHSMDRLMLIEVRNPTSGEWCAWASEKGLDSRLIAAAAMNARFFESYKDGDHTQDNPYIFHPRKNARTFLTMRSLAKCSPVFALSNRVGEKVTRAALTGLVGAAAAEKLASILAVQGDATKPDDIFSNPGSAAVPRSIAALYLTMFNALEKVKTQEDITALTDFMQRCNSVEMESVYFTVATRNKRLLALGVMRNDRIRKWAQSNLDMLV